MAQYFVYILASRRNGTLYVGVTNDLARRMDEHKQGLVEGFTKQYGVHRLVYVESTSDIRSAIEREKQLKWWKRAWKITLIEKENPQWEDLSRVGRLSFRTRTSFEIRNPEQYMDPGSSPG